jgi:hypothetical protein
VLAGPNTRLLYDVHLHQKQRLRPLLASLAGTPRISHNHGLELEIADGRRVAPTDPENVRAALLYGPTEVDAYAQNFGLQRDALHPVGIVRHEKAWVDKVVERSRSLHELPFPEFAFVVSRPAGSSYLPRARKVAALRALHQVAWVEHGLPLVLRTHPKEHEDGTLIEALPADGEGISWARSHAHPFHLATRSTIGVTFLSGVAIDLVAFGVPVIELLDVRGLPEHDGPSAARDAHGRLRFGPYRRDGLVIAADDIHDLRRGIDAVIGDRESEVRALMTGVQDRFADPTGSIARAVEILSA